MHAAVRNARVDRAGGGRRRATNQINSPNPVAARFIDHAIVLTPSSRIAAMPTRSAGSGAQADNPARFTIPVPPNLQCTLARSGTTAAGQRSFVLCFAVIASQFFPRRDLAQRIELDSVPEQSHEGVRLAGVIHELKTVAVRRRIERPSVSEFDDLDALCGTRLPACCTYGDDFPGQFANFPALRQRGAGKQAAAVNPARFHVERVHGRSLPDRE